MLPSTEPSLLAVNGGPAVRQRPFAATCFGGAEERQLLLDCLESNRWSTFRAGAQGYDVREIGCMTSAEAATYGPEEIRWLGGAYVRRFEAEMAAYTGVPFAVSANSATSGLVMAIGALDLEPGDEVLVPAMSFHASATAVLFFQAVPVFVEVKEATFCMDPDDAAAKITARTKAILVVHLGGNAADMQRLNALAQRHGLKVIEDCAQSPGVRYRGQVVGSLGDAGVYSFTETKNINCGEGGVLLTHDAAVARKARLIRNHGECVAEASWPAAERVNVVGLNLRLTELQAAVAIAQLHQLDERNALRRDNSRYLIQALAHHPWLVPPEDEAGAETVCYILKWRYVPRPGMPDRDSLVAALHAEGIPVVAGYDRMMYENPLFTDQLAFGRRGAPFTAPYYAGTPRYGTGTCPRAEAINRQFLWFAFIHPPNTRQDMDDVVRAFDKILLSRGDPS